MRSKHAALCVMFILFHIKAGYAGIEEVKEAYTKGDYAVALKEVQPLADQGNVYAQFYLGEMYASGQGVTQDSAQAVVWLRKAAEQGYVNAQISLGRMYDGEHAVPQDYAKVAVWFRKAAEQGNADAQLRLGVMYANGLGVLKDNMQAVDQYRKAAEQGSADAQFRLGMAYADGKGVTQDYVQAEAWLKKAASQGDDSANENLSIIEMKLEEARDQARGYKRISFADFQLDSKVMRSGKKLAIDGFYQITGQLEMLSETIQGAQNLNAYRVYLLTEDSPRETRKKLLAFQKKLTCGYGLCAMIVLGHVSKCERTLFGTHVANTICLVVDDIRTPRQLKN